jgi:hypothetical protein
MVGNMGVVVGNMGLVPIRNLTRNLTLAATRYTPDTQVNDTGLAHPGNLPDCSCLATAQK